MEKINLAYRRKDDLLDGVMLVKTVAARKSSNGGLYLDLTVMDATGEMNAKAWNWQDGAALPPVNTPVRVKGLITEFNGKLQLRIDRIRAAQPEEIVWEDLVPTAPRDPQEMYDELLACAKSLRNEEFSKLAVHLIEEKREKLLFWPAAVSFHHAERSGLLHDLCKMDELGAAEFGIATEYTKEGNLLGHIVEGVAHIAEVCKELGLSQETQLLVEHMVLSHHETPEYGSPKPPLFPEAQMLHLLDMMDARMYCMHEALLATPRGAFSDRVRALEGRKLYHPDLDEEQAHG